MFAVLLLFFSTTYLLFAQQGDICNYFKNCGNASQSSTSKSQPSTSSSTNFNPSNIANVKGLGLETLFQPNNPLGFNLISGNGKIGGALLSPLAENSFFGNRSIEDDSKYLLRRIEKKRYSSKKINLAIGTKLISKKHFAFDIGVSLKRNPDIKKINPGVGVSARLWILNFGANIYRDDTKIEFDTPEGPVNYSETFTAKTFSVGTQIKNLSLDAGMFKTKYAFYPNETLIYIYSSAYNYKKFLFNLAYRQEYSDNMKENMGVLTHDRVKIDYYGGIQYLWSRHLTTGVAYNNFLVKDISFTLTLFL